MSIKELHKTIHDYSLNVYEFKEHQVFFKQNTIKLWYKNMTIYYFRNMATFFLQQMKYKIKSDRFLLGYLLNCRVCVRAS